MRIIPALCAISALATTGLSQARIELINQPKVEGIFVEDGVAGYQYVYDVYMPSGAAGGFQLGGDLGPLGAQGGFVASDSAWFRAPASGNDYASIWQAWYSSSVAPTFSALWNDPAAYGDKPTDQWFTNHTHHNGSSGIGPLFPAGPVEWARINSWHLPSDYGTTSEYFFPGPGYGAQATPSTGAPYHAITGIFIGGGLELQATVRVVAPYKSDEINWYIDAPVSGTMSGPSGLAIHHLVSDVSSISSYAGGQQVLDLYAPRSEAGFAYLLMASVTGVSPGFVLDGVAIPLNIDAYSIAMLGIPNSGPYSNGFGFLEPDGSVQITITVPGGVATQGLQMHHACAVFDVLTFPPKIAGASNAQVLDFGP